MHVVALLVASLFTAAAPSGEILKQYRTSAASVGHSPEANLKLALWCEQNGLEPEREKHLSMVIVADPDNAIARGLLGHVREAGKWRTPSAVAERIKADPTIVATLNEYASRRAKAADTTDDQWKLALWCENNGLPVEATARLITVLRHDPNHASARQRLGYKRQRNGWFTDDQMTRAKAESAAQEKANRRCTSTLEALRNDIRIDSKRADAERSIACVTDPRAVPSVLRVFGSKDQGRTLQLLGQIDSIGASRAVALIAIFSNSAEVRRTATETLRMRDPREYADLLISMLRDPIHFEVKPVSGPGSTGELVIEGREYDRKRVYRAPSFVFQPGTDQIVGYDAAGMPIVERCLSYSDFSTTAATLLPELFGPSWAATTLFTSQNAVSRPDENRFISSLAQLDAGRSQQAFEHALGVAAERIGNPGPDQLAGNAYQARFNQFASILSTYGGSLNGVQKMALLENLGDPLNPGSILFGSYEQEAVIPLSRYALAAARVQSHLDQDAAMLRAYNESLKPGNERVGAVLSAATGHNLENTRKPWADWWVDQIGYRLNQRQSRLRPTYFEDVSTPLPSPVAGIDTKVLSFTRVSCFGAGTVVKTLDGHRPIESIAVGDRVLSQDPETGVLSYHPVLVVHHNPPSATLKVQVGEESVVASTFHRFWVAGHGWKMARELKNGDPIRTLDGREAVMAAEPEKVQPVFNLDVAGGHTFFVGKQGALVHDNSVPTTRHAVFDAVDAAESLASAGRE